MPTPLAPNTTPADASGAFAILAVLGDDNKFKQRLKELSDHALSIDKMVEGAKKLDADSKQRMKDLEKQKADLDNREADLKKREDSLGNARRETLSLQEQLNARNAKFDEEAKARQAAKEAEVKGKVAELAEKEKVLAAAMRDFEIERAKHQSDVVAKTRELSGWENALVKRETGLKDSEAAFEEKKAALEARLNKLDAAIKSAA